MHLRSQYPPLPELPVTNYHNFIFRGPQQAEIPDHVLYIDGVTGQTRTRYEFLERLYDGATALGAAKSVGGLGLISSDIVGILSDNCLDYMVLVHSLIAITTPFALYSTHATPREMRHCIGKSSATHIFVHASLLSQILPVARDMDLPIDRIYILEGEDRTGLNRPSFGQLIQRVRSSKIPREPVRPAGKDTLAYLVFSSGTSGLPKAVMVSHGNLAFTVMQAGILAQEIVKVTDPPPDPNAIPIILGYLPMFHSYGLHYMCLRSVLRPATVVLLPRWNIKAVIQAIPKYRISLFMLIPSVIHQLVNDPEFLKTDLSSLVTAGSGAAYLPPKLGERFQKLLPKGNILWQGYGMSEATLSLIAQPPPGLLGGRVESHWGPSVTRILLPGVEAMILRPDGTHCLPNEPGELFIKGENVTLGYWNNPEATKEAFLPNGWLRTGDRFRANTKGTFWFEDRAKDTLKISGMQVSPAEIEDVLHAEPSGIVGDVAVAGVAMAGARTSDELNPRAWIVLTAQGRELGEQEVRARLERWVKANLSKYKWLRGGVQFVEEIPKNPTGKVLRRVLQEQYANESARAKL